MSQALLVEGIPPSVTEEELSHPFSACGKVLAVSIEKTLEGVSLGIARVKMSSPEEAERALRSSIGSRSAGVPSWSFRPLSDRRMEQQSLEPKTAWTFKTHVFSAPIPLRSCSTSVVYSTDTSKGSVRHVGRLRKARFHQDLSPR